MFLLFPNRPSDHKGQKSWSWRRLGRAQQPLSSPSLGPTPQFTPHLNPERLTPTPPMLAGRASHRAPSLKQNAQPTLAHFFFLELWFRLAHSCFQTSSLTLIFSIRITPSHGHRSASAPVCWQPRYLENGPRDQARDLTDRLQRTAALLSGEQGLHGHQGLGG